MCNMSQTRKLLSAIEKGHARDSLSMSELQESCTFILPVPIKCLDRWPKDQLLARSVIPCAMAVTWTEKKVYTGPMDPMTALEGSGTVWNP